jgi:glycosyltransferase involved in cell wall biosynthesis
MVIDVSVIIPVYNLENYLEECIVSLLAQSLTNCEFIFVNDGSVDSSQKIIESYSAKDARIKLINQENKGVSAARNAGIAIAKGSYLSFVDGDDFIKSDFLEQLHRMALENNADLVISTFLKENKGSFYPTKLPFDLDKQYERSFVEETILPLMIESDFLNTSCSKLYKKSLIIENKIMFPVGVALGEDGWFNLTVFAIAQTIYCTSYSGYFYREVIGSATRNMISKDYFQRALEVYYINYDSVIKGIIPEEKRNLLRSKRLVNQVISLLSIYQNSNNGLSFYTRLKYCKKICKNKIVVQVIKDFWNELIHGKNRFSIFILYCIKNRLFVFVWLALGYSNLKNK